MRRGPGSLHVADKGRRDLKYKMQTKRREFILWIEGFAFGLIILLGWLTEILRVPHFLFAEPAVANWGRPLLKTLVVVSVWTAVHIATRRLLNRLHHLEEYLRICAWCRKMDHEGEWMTIEDYFGSAFATKTSHGVCPECSRNLEKSVSGGRVATVRKEKIAQDDRG
jgi:hypothetical protein